MGLILNRGQQSAVQRYGIAAKPNYGKAFAVPVPLTTGIPKSSPVEVNFEGISIQLLQAFAREDFVVYVRFNDIKAERFPLFRGVPRYASFERAYIDTAGLYPNVANAKIWLEISTEQVMPSIGQPHAPITVTKESPTYRTLGYFELNDSEDRQSLGSETYDSKLLKGWVQNEGPDPCELFLDEQIPGSVFNGGLVLYPGQPPFEFDTWYGGAHVCRYGYRGTPLGATGSVSRIRWAIFRRYINGSEFSE